LVKPPQPKMNADVAAAILEEFEAWAENPEDPWEPERTPTPAARELDQVVVQKALSGVARVNGRFNLRVVADLLVGERTGCLSHTGLDRVKTFGALADHRREWVTEVLVRCEKQGLIESNKLTAAGGDVMRGLRPACVTAPQEAVKQEWEPEEWEPVDEGENW